MEITYGDAVDGFTTYFNSKECEKDLRVVTSGSLRAPSALNSVQVLDNLNDYALKTSFIHSMLVGQSVQVFCKDEVLVAFQVTDGMQLDSVEYFRLHPGVFKFVIDALFSVFLKNLYPSSGESLKTDE